MERSQLTGALIMVGAIFQMILFLWSVARKSYMAVALPMMGAIAAVSALAFWIGWTMFTAEEEPEEELEGGETALEP
jgi:hypothetical protein